MAKWKNERTVGVGNLYATSFDNQGWSYQGNAGQAERGFYKR
jgi:hypothetical protein